MHKSLLAATTERLAVFAFAIVPVACDGGSATHEQTRTASDSRFASAEALIDYYNSISLRGAAAGASWLDLIYAETDLQRRLRYQDSLAGRMHHVDVLMFERFGESLRDPGKGDYLLRPLGPGAVLVENDGARAFADLTDGKRTARRALYLVKVGERWWISGYTFEYSMSESDAEEIARTSEVYELMVEAVEGIEPRLRAGEFSTAAAVRDAYKEALFLAATPEWRP